MGRTEIIAVWVSCGQRMCRQREGCLYRFQMAANILNERNGVNRKVEGKQQGKHGSCQAGTFRSAVDNEAQDRRDREGERFGGVWESLL